MIEVVIAQTQEELQQVMRVRHQVFVVEQNVPVDLERDDADRSAVHFLARRDGQVTGAARLVIQGDSGKVGRMSVLAQFRGLGIGRALMASIEVAACELGLSSLILNAQDHALGFYQTLGYEAAGDELVEAGIVHVPMVKRLETRC